VPRRGYLFVAGKKKKELSPAGTTLIKLISVMSIHGLLLFGEGRVRFLCGLNPHYKPNIRSIMPFVSFYADIHFTLNSFVI
jgi:hypothetical protein